jgi:glycosyltransferase involved in cell wall biosynthesis
LSDRAFIPAEENVNILLRKYPFLQGKLLQMNNFIDTSLFKKISSSKKYDIVYVARFERDKNHSLLLKAVTDSGLRLLFIGKGPEQERIRKEIQNLGLEADILSKVENQKLPALYNASKICVFPSLHEGNPKALLEAMSCELACVGLDVPGVNTLIQDQKTGLLSPIDKDSLRRAIFRLLQDDSLREELGRAGRNFIVNYYTLKKLLQDELGVYLYNLTTEK